MSDNAKDTYAIRSSKPSISLYDDPVAWFTEDHFYKFIILLCMMQSNSVLVFLRYRIGRRIMRGWIFQMLFVFLLCGAGLGGRYTNTAIDAPLAFFALFMGLLAIYHNSVGKELTKVKDPDLMLHTLSRGDSYLTALMSIIPRISIPWFECYSWRSKKVRIFPLSEETVQGRIEPVVLAILGAYFFFWHKSFLSAWLELSAITLFVVESDYHAQVLNTALDQFDSQIEARIMRETQAAYSQGKKPTHSKMNGISVATASEHMVRLSELSQQSQ